jgi:hypothetical protein
MMDLTAHIQAFTEYLRQLDRSSLTDEERQALRAMYRQLLILEGERPPPTDG